MISFTFFYISTNTVYTHPTSSGYKHIPSGGSAGQILRWSSDGTAVWGSDNNTTYGTGTSTASGLTKLYTGTGAATDGTMTQSAITSALNNSGYIINPNNATSVLSIVNGWDSSANVPDDFKSSLNILITVWTNGAAIGNLAGERVQMMFGSVSSACTAPVAYRVYVSSKWTDWFYANRCSSIPNGANFDNYTSPGLYFYSNVTTAKNKPANYGNLYVYHSPIGYTQLSIDLSGTLATRVYTSNGWTSWGFYSPSKTKAHE